MNLKNILGSVVCWNLSFVYFQKSAFIGHKDILKNLKPLFGCTGINGLIRA